MSVRSLDLDPHARNQSQACGQRHACPTREEGSAPADRDPAAGAGGGRRPLRRQALRRATRVEVSADIFRDGHDLLRAVVRYRGPDDADWREAELRRIDAHLGGVRWSGAFTVDRMGRWEYTFEAWTDVFGTWRDELARKVAADQHDLAGEMSEGVLLLQAAAASAGAAASRPRGDRARAPARSRTSAVPENAKHDVALGPELFAAVERTQERHGA